MKSGKLNSYSILSVNGRDAATFLQGQFTNDVNLLDSQWQYSGYCNPKGRLLALLLLWKARDDQFYALLSSDLAEQILKRLKMYVMRSEVRVEILNKTITGFESFEYFEEYNPTFIESADVTSTPNARLIRGNECLLKITNRYLFVSDQTDFVESFDSLWLTHNIKQGIPQITAETSESFIPQMINLDLLDGVNFKKGCYTGQEIVARMHYLGNLKQRMFVCQIDAENVSIRSGDKIYDAAENGKTAGNVLNVSSNGKDLLTVLKLATLSNKLYLENGTKIKPVKPQPYPIPIQLKSA